MLRSVLAIAALFAAASATPAVEIGRTTINGQTVIIEDDFTWHHPVTCTKAQTFTSTEVNIAVCVPAADWVQAPTEEGHEFTFYSADDNFGLALINEPDVTSNSNLRELILGNARAASTTSPVDVVAEYEVKVAGRTWQLIEFTLAFGATTFHFVNAYTTGEGYGSSQIALWTLPELVEDLYTRANDVIAGVSFPVE